MKPENLQLPSPLLEVRVYSSERGKGQAFTWQQWILEGKYFLSPGKDIQSVLSGFSPNPHWKATRSESLEHTTDSFTNGGCKKPWWQQDIIRYFKIIESSLYIKESRQSKLRALVWGLNCPDDFIKISFSLFSLYIGMLNGIEMYNIPSMTFQINENKLIGFGVVNSTILRYEDLNLSQACW